ncbi:hypothetical protein BGZ57DRAFT_589460 [Hyaloscypha finlandica]|nr:hypothetical protein BGZ57DRAFT_589460 [Hyaloscypha finlandica]
MITLKFLLGLVLALYLQTAWAYNQNICCELATCGQNYLKGQPAAPSLWVSYKFCSSQCPGMQLSKASEPTQWASVLINFILPSVIFSMTIPRRKKIEFNYLFEFEWPRHATRYPKVNDYLQLLFSLICFLVLLIPVTIDTVLWISVIVIGAGNMLVGGLDEAHLDYRILKYTKDKAHGIDEDELRIKRELLVTVASGNLMLEKGNPQRSIPASLTIPGEYAPKDGYEKARSRLLNLLGAQSRFGELIGSPVLFYLGTFLYTTLDLRNSLSDEDTAISLGFGIEWMIIVHVAIISGCLLASNNPSTSAGIVGSGHEELEYEHRKLQRRATFVGQNHGLESPGWTWERFAHSVLGWSDAYETEFQPVSLWERGSNKMKWIKKSEAWKQDPDFRRLMEVTPLGWFFKIFLPALALVVLPPGSGGVVAYWTPPRGVGCRSLSFLLYALCQTVITGIAVMRCANEDNEWQPSLQEWSSGWRFKALSAPFWLLSLLSAIGGTFLQIVGVFRNCFCKTTMDHWLKGLAKRNPRINLATDTDDARTSSNAWIVMGALATVFMAVTCYGGWWYQRMIRQKFIEAVKGMWIPGSFLTTQGSGRDLSGGAVTRPDERDSMMDPLLPGEASPMWSEDSFSTFESRQFELGRHSSIRGSSPEPSGMTTSIHTPSITVSYDEGGEDIGLLSFDHSANSRRPRPRTNS